MEQKTDNRKQRTNILRYLTPNTWLRRARLSRKLHYYTIIGLMLLVGGGVFLWQMFNPFGAAAWYNDAWKYRMQLTFDNSGQAVNLTDFPVMVHLTSSNFDFNKADFQGRDIRFTDSDGTTLIHYEVEKYDKAGRDAVLYVKVPQIDSSSSTDSIYMYYGGNDTHSYTPDPENVWPTEMRGRFHMSEKQLKANAVISNAASSSATLFEYDAAASDTGTSAGAIRFTGSATNTQGTSPLFQEPVTYYGKINESDLSNTSVGLASSSATIQLAQGFKVPRTVNIGAIRFEWGDIGTPTVLAVKATIQTDSGGVPSGSTITGGTSSCSGSLSGVFTSGDTRPFEFTSRPQVQANTQYHIVVEGFTDTTCATPKATAESGNNFQRIWNDSTGEYPGGSMSTYDGATWTPLPNADAIFDVYDDTFNITSNITIGAWVRPTSTNPMEIMNKATRYYGNWYGQQGYALRTDSSLQPFFYVNRGTMPTEIGVTSSTALPLNQWSYVVGRIDGSTIKVYVNGVETGSANTSLVPAFTGDPLTIANNASFNTRDWTGQIDEAFVYNGALSAEWIKASFMSENGTFTTYGTEERGENVYDPVAYWKLDEGQGNVASSSASSNIPVGLYNSPTWQAENQCVVGKCLYFDGSDDYGSAGDNNTLDFGTTDSFSVSVWFKSSGTDSFAVNKRASSTSVGYDVVVGSSSTPGVIQARVGDGVDNLETSISSWTGTNDNKWHHAVLVLDRSSNTMKLYGDGILRESVSASAIGSVENTVPFQIGARDAGALFTGFIDEVKVYPFALSDSQAKADFTTGGAVLGAKDQSFLSDGLVGYWDMDETAANSCSGGVNDSCDSSGNGFDGSWSGDTTASMSAKFGAGTVFDGTGDYITTSNSTTLQPSTNLTVSAWFKTTTTGNGRILSKGVSNTGYELILNGSNRVEFNLGINSTEHDITSDSTGLANGVWHHVVGTYDGTTMKMYIDGVLQSDTEVFPGTINYSVNSLTIGANIALTGTYTGVIDDVRVYNRTFSSHEVASLYEWAPGPIRYWSFEDPSRGNTVSEVTGNGTTGSWLGTGTQHWDQGKYGQAGKFVSSTADRINTGGSVTATGNISMMAWVKPRTLSGDSYIYWKNGKWTFSLNESSPGLNFGSCRVSCGFGIVTFPYTFIPGTWYHVAITSDNTNIYGYVNGVLIGSAAANGVFTDGAGDDYIGGRDNAASSIDANIDDLKIYNYARSTKQIIEDMNASHPAGGSPVGSMLGHWKFDGGSGNVASNSGSLGGAAHGNMYHFTSPSSNSSGWTSHGKVNKALRFDGADDYIEMSDLFYNESISVCAWINPRSLGAVLKTIVSKRNSAGGAAGGVGGDEWLFYVSSDKLSWTSWDSGGSTSVSVTGSTTLQTNRWYHVCGVQNGIGNPAYVYINGVQDGTSTQTGVMQNATSRIQIGGRTANNNTRYWNGDIDEVKIYNYALSPSEVRIDMNQGSALTFGVLGTDIDGKTASNSASRMYCPPGDTSVVCAPVGEWRFEERQGDRTRDTSGNEGTAVLTSSPTWVRGKVGSALQFNGSSSYAQAPDSSTLDVTAVSVSAWVKVNSWTGSFPRIMGKSGAYDLVLLTDGGSRGQLNWKLDNGAGDIFTGAVINELNRWYHVVATYSSGTGRVYVDGVRVLEDTGMTNGTLDNSGNGFSMGAQAGGAWFFDGAVDEVKVYNYVLSPSQVAWDYNRGKPVAYYKMDDCQGTSPKDSSGNGKHGTLTLSAGGVTSAGTCSTSSTAWGNGASGKYNYSLSFDGTDDYVSLPIGLDAAGDSVKDYNSVSFWMYPRQDLRSTAQGILSSDGTDDCGDLKLNTSTNQLNFFQRCYGSPYVDITNDNFQNTWTHVAVTFDGGTQKVYINGRERTLIDGGSQNINWVTANVGRVNQAGVFTYFDGIIDEFQVFNYPLTAAQVRNVFNQSSAVRFGPSSGAP